MAALVAERAQRRGVSINREINDAILRDAESDLDDVRERARANVTKYDTVMKRLG